MMKSPEIQKFKKERSLVKMFFFLNEACQASLSKYFLSLCVWQRTYGKFKQILKHKQDGGFQGQLKQLLTFYSGGLKVVPEDGKRFPVVVKSASQPCE